MYTHIVNMDPHAPRISRASVAPRRRSGTMAAFPQDRQHRFIQQAFRAAGGIASGDQIAYLLRDHIDQPISTVARWIVGREVVSYEWRCQPMLPLFQFDLSRMALRAPVAEVVRELRAVYTDWCLAMWFVAPNVWLDGAQPVQTIEADPTAVLEAARTDRLVMSY